MKKLLILAAVAGMSFAANAQQTMWVHTGQVHWVYKTDTVGDMPYQSANLLTVLEKGYTLTNIDSITVKSEDFADNNVLVNYNGTTADVYVSGNIANLMTVSVTGANVAITQGNVTNEVTYTLQGETSSGYFKQTGSYKSTIVLNGVNITATSTLPAIWIANGKRIDIELAEGTDNYLTDASTNGKKACFFVKGHAEFKGGGNLTITGNKKHAFASNEYCEIKKSVGSITVKSAVGDAFNVVQYFKMNGGTVTVESCGDDGIQCDAETATNPDEDGHVEINGGTLTINNTVATTKCIKAEGDVNINGGTITLNNSGAGEYDTDDAEVKSAYGIKTDRNITINGEDAVLDITMSGNGARGMKCDTTFTMAAGTATITCTDGDCIESGDTASVKCVRDSIAVFTGGEITVNTTQDEAEGIHSDGTTTVSGGTINLITYDHGLKSEGDMTMTDGTINYTVTGPASKAIKPEANLYVSGGTISGTVSGGGETASDETVAASAGIKCGGNITVDGGTFVLKATGDGDKGINCDGTITINGGDFNVTTTGARYGDNSSGTGGWGGWGPGDDPDSDDSDKSSSAKGIRAEGDITINDGTFVLSTTGGEGSEAIESKAVMTINGGTLEIEAYDDAMNSSSHMYVNGGHIYTHATNNDGLDSNGDMYLNGGVLMVYGAGDPECAFDAAEEYNLYVTGGTFVGIGGSNWSAPTTCTNVQPCISYSGTQSVGTTYLLRSSNTNILAWTVTNSISSGGGGMGPGGSSRGSSALVVISSPSLTKGSSYTLYSGATVTGYDEDWHSLYINPTTSSTGSSLGSVSSLATPYSSIGSSRW